MKKTPLEYAMNLLKVRDRSEGEMRQKMKLRGYFLEEIESAVDFLKQKKFLDDSKFVHNYVDSQRRQGQAGRFKIRCRLKGFNLADDLVEEALSNISDEEELQAARSLAAQWVLRKKDKELSSDKLGRFLLGRGFNYGIVIKVLESLKK
jgi:regulatory protein